MLKSIKQKLKGNIAKKVIKKIFNFYSTLETIYPEPLDIKESDKILILAPHADDESIGCGGLLLKYANQCDVVCVTNCRTGNLNVSSGVAITERKNEFKIAMESVNVNHYYFNTAIDSDSLEKEYHKFSVLLNKYQLNNYSHLCIPIFYDQHQDHKALSKLLQKYLNDRKIKNTITILFYEVWSTVLLANRYIDLSDNLEKKSVLIGHHVSQIKDIDYRERISALNIYRGMIVNKKAAEVYFEIKIKEFRELEL